MATWLLTWIFIAVSDRDVLEQLEKGHNQHSLAYMIWYPLEMIDFSKSDSFGLKLGGISIAESSIRREY